MHPYCNKISAFYLKLFKRYCKSSNTPFFSAPFPAKTICAPNLGENKPFCLFPPKTTILALQIHRNQDSFAQLFQTLALVYFQHNSLWTACIPAPKFYCHLEDQQQAFEEWKDQIILALTASNFREGIWLATIIEYIGKEGFK